MSQWFTPASSHTPILFPIVFLALAAAMSAPVAAEDLFSRSPERGGIGLELQQLQFDKTFSNKSRPLREGLLSKLDERLSLIVTDKASTSAIKFSDVMGNLAADMYVKPLTLFQRWWDTANNGDKSACAVNRFCNCETDVLAGLSRVNGFPYQCPRNEGNQSILNPFENEADGYTAIAYVNRFDLADKQSGRHCGEFRIIFARNSGFTDPVNRNLLIFEALVPNPDPWASPDKDGPFAKLAGCRPIVEFWLTLSDTSMDPVDRGIALRSLFLDGLKADSIAIGLPKHDIGPIVNARHYAGGPASGQIRTNQFMQGNWTLREFKTCGGSIIPATVKSNPGNDLFSSFASEDPRKRELENYLVSQDTLDNLRGMGSLKEAAAERNMFTFAFALTTAELDHLNSFDSMAEKKDHGDVAEAFKNCGGKDNCPLGKTISAKLRSVSPLNADIILQRIRTQTCAGCHHFSNRDDGLGVDCPDGWPDWLCYTVEEKGIEVRRGIWPSTLPVGGGTINTGFTHVSEEEVETLADSEVLDLREANLETITPQKLIDLRPKRITHLSYRGPDGDNTRYKISDTLKFLLVPPRYENMVLYLNEFDPPP